MTISPLGHMCLWSACACGCILLGPPTCVWHVYVCMSMWRPEVDIKCLSWMFSSLCVACEEGMRHTIFFASVTSHLLPESLHLPPAFQDYRWTTMHMGIDRDSVSLNFGFQICVSSAFPTVLSSYPLWIILKTTVLYLSPYGYYNHISETI